MRRAVARTGLLLPALAAEGLAAALTLAPGLWPLATAAAAVAVGVLLLVVVLRRRLRRGRAVRLLVATAVCAGAVGVAVGLQEPVRAPAWLPIGPTVPALLRIDSVAPVSLNDRAGTLTRRLLVKAVLVRATVSGVARAAAAPLVVFADRLPTAAQAPGTTVAVDLVLQRAPPDDDVAFTATTAGGVRITGRADPVQRAAQGLRTGLARRAAGLPGDGGALLPGLSIGDTSRVGRLARPGDEGRLAQPPHRGLRRELRRRDRRRARARGPRAAAPLGAGARSPASR